MSYRSLHFLPCVSIFLFWQQPTRTSCNCSECPNHRKIYFHNRNKPNHGSIWSGLRPPLFIRPRFGCLVQTVVLGRFHTCNFGLDQMDKSESTDQMSYYMCERDHWHTCHVYCSICHSIARKADGHQRSLQSCWWELFPIEINRFAMSSSTTE